MIDAARRASADRITAVIPFYAYARQDRKDQPRVPITAKLVANLLVAAGAHRVVAIDLHAGQIQGFFDIPLDHLYAFSVLHEYIIKKDLKNLVTMSADLGGVKMADAYARALKSGLGFVAKKRYSGTQVEATNVVGDVEGCDVLLVDERRADLPPKPVHQPYFCPQIWGTRPPTVHPWDLHHSPSVSTLLQRPSPSSGGLLL